MEKSNVLSMKELLETDFDQEIEETENRENLAWLVISRDYAIITK